MTAYDQIYKAYTDSKKNGFWDAWGIVANPKTIYELKAECMERIVAYDLCIGMIDSIFGLVLIPCNDIEDNRAYIVDEQLGRTILGNTERALDAYKKFEIQVIQEPKGADDD